VRTAYSTTIIIASTTDTITEVAATQTVSTTTIEYDLQQMRAKRDDVELGARTAVTASAIQPAIEKAQLEARQASSTYLDASELSSISSAIVSACSCLDLPTGTDYVTATAPITVKHSKNGYFPPLLAD